MAVSRRAARIVATLFLLVGLVGVATAETASASKPSHPPHPHNTTTTTTVPATTSTTSTSSTSTTSTTSTSTTTTTIPQGGGLPSLPATWPRSFELGQASGPGEAAGMRQIAPFAFRYQYLAGGANTGNGWAGWNPNGTFVSNYITETQANGMIPVFTYYQLWQSNPGQYANLTNASTMAAYWNDVRLFMERAANTGPVILHVEPDLSAFMQQHATNDDATTVPVSVASSGQVDVQGLPNNAAGFSQAFVRLRNLYAPNVVLGYHFSTWATGNDFIYSDPSDATVSTLADRTAKFYATSSASFNIAFHDLSDRDAAFKQYVYGDGGASWYNADDYRRSTVFVGEFDKKANLRVALWQMPFGNTLYRAENNTWEHYQDNKVQTLLDPGRAELGAYINAGVVAILFGRGADGPTCPCDAAGDGITNPAPINGNTLTSINADDDGGYFNRVAAPGYYSQGKVNLP
jgi:hypothetical protein